MLHELLLALLGFTGDFVLDASPARRRAAPLDAESGGGDADGELGPAFRLAPDLTFLQPSERSAIERLISLGFYYRELNRFATESRDLSWIQSSVDVSSPYDDKTQKGKARKGSVYRRAIANGITEILSVYRSAVLQVEQNLLSDPLPILATVTHGLNKFEVLLPPLYELVTEIEQKDIRGGQLLNLLHKRCHCGVPELQSCIQRQDDRDGENDSSQRDVSDKFMQKLAKDTSLSSWHTGFHVSLDMLPEYIHMRVAESILFAGKAIRVLRNPSPGATLQEPINQNQSSKRSHRMQSFIGSSGSPKDLPNFSSISAEELLPQAEADRIDAMLKELKHSSEFHKRLFESAVGSIRTIAANHLWQLVVVRADLNGHLKALKDYFLLAKGDFFQAALKTIGEEDKYFTRVSLRMLSYGMKSSTSQKDLQKPNASELPSQGKAASELALDGWDSIALEYSVDWPLQLFFTPDVLSKYLSALVSQSFLDIGSVSRILDSIMKLCLQFCWSIEQYETRPNISEIDHITEEFNKKSNSLYTILRSSRLAGSQRAPFLRQFLMRLNFNSFFETTARGVMNSGRLRLGTAGA
nr:unnamed protein product [Digitaria exilis]